jgi:hypothetical protein
VKLSWTVSTGASDYSLERSTTSSSAGFAVLSGAGALATTTWSDSTVAGSKTYYYRVRAHNSAGYSPYSNALTVKTPAR